MKGKSESSIHVKQTPTIHYRKRINGNEYRVWRSDWYGDQFETLNEEQFKAAKEVFKRFSFALIEEFD